jgi:soluble lytic murein transglycosylase-like protein
LIERAIKAKVNLSQLQSLLVQAGWPNVTVSSRSGQVPLIPLMASIALAESSGDPNAHNSSGEDSVGLLQINRRAHPGYSVAQLKDPLTNAQVALQIFQHEGLNAWGAYTDGGYRSRGQFNQSLALYGGGSSNTSFQPPSLNYDPANFDTVETVDSNAYGSYEEYLAAVNSGSGQIFSLNDYVGSSPNPFDSSASDSGIGTIVVVGVIAVVGLIALTR